MNRPPAYIFVVRHGNRLDAADKQWHLSSPTPYDPPLTYGGWMQCKTLGARIASILQDRETEDEVVREVSAPAVNEGTDKDKTQPRKKRRYKVILHTSPFLRCIQTSIAIGAGLASNPSPSKPSAEDLQSLAKPLRMNQLFSFSNPASTRIRPAISTDVAPSHARPVSIHIEKSILRLDPFLGEWASPDYFEHITPPPRSSLMLTAAKAELLRKESHSNYSHFSFENKPSTPSQLWNSPSQSTRLGSFSESATGGSALASLPELEESLPGGQPSTNSNWKLGHRASTSEPSIPKGYIAPVPTYALSSSEPIPIGYVAHARDACVDVDYQWDSTPDSLGWGDGGALPEEWPALHQRLRKGLKRLVDWYATANHPAQMVTKTATTAQPVSLGRNGVNDSVIYEDDDIETENVVILVSHGACCNALVGGITNQPVLADFPVSSLSMARRRPEFDNVTGVVDGRAMASLDDAFSRTDCSVPELYELPMLANTDHLLPPGSASVSRSSSVNNGSRGRIAGGFTSALREINLGAQYGQSPEFNSRSSSANASLGSMRRGPHGHSLASQFPPAALGATGGNGITVGSGITSFRSGIRTNSWGLWAPQQEVQDAIEEPDPPLTLNSGLDTELKKLQDSGPPISELESKPEQQNGLPPVLCPNKKEDGEPEAPLLESEEHDYFDEDSLPIGLGSGLWGTPRPPGEAERNRDFTAQKRRWTVTER
ncbi:phosphoglycerate mutase [Xylariales sp. AK1849]|nr:phosphoglycerate mutase [Xylariales sp. AK1849]